MEALGGENRDTSLDIRDNTEEEAQGMRVDQVILRTSVRKGQHSCLIAENVLALFALWRDGTSKHSAMLPEIFTHRANAEKS